MSIVTNVVTLTTDLPVGLTTAEYAEVFDVWISPSTTIYIGGTTDVAGSSNGVMLTTSAQPVICLQLYPGDKLYAAPASSSARTVGVLIRT